MKGKLLSILLSSLFVFSGFAQQTRELTAEKANEYGIVYSLPETSLRVDVTARHITRKAGPYFQYAKKYLAVDNPIKENSDIWTITDVKVTPFGMPDRDVQYVMQAKAGSPVSVCVDENGMLLGINCLVDAQELPPLADSKKTVVSPVTDNEYLQYVGEDFIASQSSAKRAQMLAEALMEIRDSKIALTRGTADPMPSDGKQLELMLKSLAHQEEALMSAFTGISEEEVVTASYIFTPDKEGKSILFRMSDFAGFVESDDYAGDPVSITVSDVAEPEIPTDAKGEVKKLPKEAVIYKIPGSAVISIIFNGKTLYKKELQFGQFGLEYGLNPQMFIGKKERSSAIFSPVTGGLLEVKSE